MVMELLDLKESANWAPVQKLYLLPRFDYLSQIAISDIKGCQSYRTTQYWRQKQLRKTTVCTFLQLV